MGIHPPEDLSGGDFVRLRPSYRWRSSRKQQVGFFCGLSNGSKPAKEMRLVVTKVQNFDIKIPELF